MSMRCTDLSHDQLPQETMDTGNLNGIKGKITEEKCSQVQTCRNHLQTRKYLDCKFWEVERVSESKRRIELPAMLLH